MENNYLKDSNVVTMVDILNKEIGTFFFFTLLFIFILNYYHIQDLDEYSNAVLNGSDDTDCTYLKGYIKRQALYSCLTCIPEAKLDYSKAIGNNNKILLLKCYGKK